MINFESVLHGRTRVDADVYREKALRNRRDVWSAKVMEENSRGTSGYWMFRILLIEFPYS